VDFDRWWLDATDFIWGWWECLDFKCWTKCDADHDVEVLAYPSGSNYEANLEIEEKSDVQIVGGTVEPLLPGWAHCWDKLLKFLLVGFQTVPMKFGGFVRKMKYL